MGKCGHARAFCVWEKNKPTHPGVLGNQGRLGARGREKIWELQKPHWANGDWGGRMPEPVGQRKLWISESSLWHSGFLASLGCDHPLQIQKKTPELSLAACPPAPVLTLTI